MDFQTQQFIITSKTLWKFMLQLNKELIFLTAISVKYKRQKSSLHDVILKLCNLELREATQQI